MINSTHLHAMVIHFPVALLLIGFFSELAGIIFKRIFFNKMAFYLLILGTLGAVASYVSGNAAGEGMEDGTLGKAIALHENAANITLWLAVVTALLYGAAIFFRESGKWIKILGVVAFAALIASVSRTAYLGGQLVYKHGAGVELGLPGFNENESATVP